MGRRLGQHFLVNEDVAHKIVDAANPVDTETVLEIGPGKGILTNLLVPRVKKLIAVEIDPVLAERLKNKFSKNNNFEIIKEDFLNLEPLDIPDIKFVANLPYYITSPIIQKIISWPRWKAAYIMIQKEVADRLAAKSGGGDYGVLTISVALKANVERLFNVPSEDFFPKPKVNSTVICMVPHNNYKLSIDEEQNLFRIVRACFQQRRKFALNSISRNLKLDKKIVEDAMLSSGLKPTMRAEEINLNDYLKLSKKLS